MSGMTFEGAHTATRPGGAPARRGLLGNARSAAMLAADHPELWAAGALAQLAFLGWLPFVVAIVALPGLGDLGLFWSSVALAPSFPLNFLDLAAATVLAVVAASMLVATG